MSCENCTINIRNVIGTPSAYKIRWTVEDTDGNPVYIHNGPLTQSDITGLVDPSTGEGGLQIEAGGPGHPTLGQFWSGNTISIRFENFYNPECYLDKEFSCVPATTTTIPETDCCAGFDNIIETHGLYTDPESVSDPPAAYQQQQLWGMRTLGFADGQFAQRVGDDGKSWELLVQGGGKICFPAVDADDLNVLSTPNEWSIYLRNTANQVVDATGTPVNPIAPAGVINMTRSFVSDNTIVYTAPNTNLCFRGQLTGTGGTVILNQITL